MLARHGGGGNDAAALGDGHQFLDELIDARFVLRLVGRIAAQCCGILSALRGQQHVHHGTDEYEGRGEHVDPDASDLSGGVVAEQFHPEPPDAVGGHVQRE